VAFSSATFLTAADLAERLTQAEVTRLFQRIDYVDRRPDESKSKRLSRFLDDGPLRAGELDYDGEARDRGPSSWRSLRTPAGSPAGRSIRIGRPKTMRAERTLAFLAAV
jgi:hypothetical protein